MKSGLATFLCLGLLLCISASLKGQSSLVLLQSPSFVSKYAMDPHPSVFYHSIFQDPYHKLLYEKAICSRVLGKNGAVHCPKHDLIRDIHRISRHLDGYRKFKSKCGRVNYKINDDNFTIKINLNRLSVRS